MKIGFYGRYGLCLVCLFCKVNYAAAILLGYANCQRCSYLFTKLNSRKRKASYILGHGKGCSYSPTSLTQLHKREKHMV